MAAKAFRILTLVFLLTLTVAPWTATVLVSPAAAACGSNSGPGANGDPDVPKDTGPNPIIASSGAGVSSAGDGIQPVRPGGLPGNGRASGWTMVQQFVNTLLGRPGLLR